MVLSALLAAGPAGADTRRARDEVRRKRAAAAATVDVAKASDAQVEAALATLEDEVRRREATYASARQAEQAAMDHAASAAASATAAAARVSALDRLVTEQAVDAFISGGTGDTAAVLGAGDAVEAGRRSALLGFQAGNDSELLDRLRSAKADLDAKESEARRAASQATQRKQALAGELRDVAAARDHEATVADAAQQRVDDALAESAGLAALDAQLSAQLTREQAALAARLAATRVARPAGTPTVRPNLVPVAGGLVSVRGITVAASLAGPLADLLRAADADGIALGGTGYRDPGDQIALREAHCGSSQYDIYSKPSTECSPPTAPPGTSMHEQGLAIDFTADGQVITSRASAGFRWLSANAARFGLYNLPREPWHWSVNGR